MGRKLAKLCDHGRGSPALNTNETHFGVAMQSTPHQAKLVMPKGTTFGVDSLNVRFVVQVAQDDHASPRKALTHLSSHECGRNHRPATQTVRADCQRGFSHAPS